MVMIRFSANSFRNLANLDIPLHNKNNVFWGGNGQGKTNLLEGIHFLTTLRSFRGRSHQGIINYDKKRAQLELEFNNLTGPHKVNIVTERGGKTVFYDDKLVGKSSYVSRNFLPVVISGEAIFFFKNFPIYKRSFFDRYMCFAYDDYLTEYKDYTRITKQKNLTLRNKRTKLDFDLWNKQLSKKVALISKWRGEFVESINKRIKEEAQEFFKEGENLKLIYKPSIAVDYKKDTAQVEKEIMGFLAKNADKERKRERVLYGSHLDNYQLSFYKGEQLSDFSVGQYKVAFCVLQFSVTKQLMDEGEGEVFFLLDDMFSDLDQQTQNKLLKKIENSPQQKFITSNTKEQVRLGKEARFFEIDKGEIVST
ncbi:MAG: DNA replication/repair protein RecF [SAR324 cluster bacterium]|nr:DNA replication/repair protein RecF [SAR324 cluster bacterium]